MSQELNGTLTNTADLIGNLTIGADPGTDNYNELINKPSINSVTLQGNKTTSDLLIDYADLLNKPTIPAAQVNSDWNAVSGVAQILNKPNLSAVATSGDYDDLLNKPNIPTKTSDLTNDSGFIGFTDVTGTLTAGQTSLTLQNASITTNSNFDIYCDIFGVKPTNAVVTSGQIVLTFLSQNSDLSVKVRVS